jgi:hypothetical protein
MGTRYLSSRQLFLTAFLVAGLLKSSVSAQSGVVYPRGTNLTSLWVLPGANFGSAAEQVMAATLQGWVARQSSEQIYLDAGTGYSIWKNHLHQKYGFPMVTATSPWSLLRHFKGQVDGYVLYDSTHHVDSINAATSMAGLLRAVAVDQSIEAQVRAAGLTNRLWDARLDTPQTIWSNGFRRFNPQVVVEQRPTISANLRDYATMAGAFTFFDGNSPFRSQVMAGVQSDGACLGWGDASQGENVFVSDGSRHGVHTVAADYAMNLSTLSSVRDDSLSQANQPVPVDENGIHQVSFLVTDGDNVQWALGGFPGYFSHPLRGTFDLGWALPPALADLAPSALRWFFDKASSGRHHDHFVAGVSGNGYFYPSQFPPSALAVQVGHLGPLLDRADLGIVQILDFNSYGRMDLWNTYFSQPNIEALFYLEYAPYNGAHGAVSFATNGNPVIAARDLMWPGLEDGPQLIQRLNSYPRDPTSPEAYSLVPVLVWGETVASMAQVVSNLVPQVRVVTPDTLVRQIRGRVSRNLKYPFTLGLQGWAGGTSGKAFDKALWTVTGGFSGGGLQLDGSDLGHPDSQPNAWFSRQITLPSNATDLSFNTMANNDGQLRVRLDDGMGHRVTLLDWEKLPQPNVWVRRTASLRIYAGKTVTLWIEQNDGGKGSGEYRYVDNLTVNSDGIPVFKPMPPKLLSVACTSGVEIVWRDNDIGESGFRLERRLGLSGAWAPLAELGTNVTRYVDSTVTAGNVYQYRVRSWNASGASEASQPRSVTVPPRPKLTVGISAGQLGLEWPTSSIPSSLWSRSALGSPGTWMTVQTPPAVSNDQWVVHLPLDASSHFYQLR